jgi:hypothetical protein
MASEALHSDLGGGRRGAPSFAVDGRELVATDARGRTHRYRLGRSAGEAAGMALMQNDAPVGRNRSVLAITDGTGRWLATAPLRGFSTAEAGRFASDAGLELHEADEPTDAEVRRAIARDKPVDLAASSFEVVIVLVLLASLLAGIAVALTGVVHPAVAIIGLPLFVGVVVVVVAVVRRGKATDG